MRLKIIVASACVILAACQGPPDIKQLENEKGALDAQLFTATVNASDLRAEKQALAADNAELKRVMAILGAEKNIAS